MTFQQGHLRQAVELQNTVIRQKCVSLVAAGLRAWVAALLEQPCRVLRYVEEKRGEYSRHVPWVQTPELFQGPAAPALEEYSTWPEQLCLSLVLHLQHHHATQQRRCRERVTQDAKVDGDMLPQAEREAEAIEQLRADGGMLQDEVEEEED
eukprot:gene5589-163_t